MSTEDSTAEELARRVLEVAAAREETTRQFGKTLLLEAAPTLARAYLELHQVATQFVSLPDRYFDESESLKVYQKEFKRLVGYAQKEPK